MFLRRLRLPALAFALLAVPALRAQAPRTESRSLAFSLWAGGTGTETGFTGYRNLAITAGVDAIFHPDRRLAFAAELRGSYPVDRGSLVGEENFLAGPRVSYRVHHVFRPYVDVLAGRGSLDFGSPGVYAQSEPLIYQLTDGGVLAFGGGVDIDVFPALALKLDAQSQRYQTEVTASGNVTAAAYTVGAEYTFHFGHSRQE
jgi:hypothetical protein